MNVTKFLETLAKLLSEQEGIKIDVKVTKREEVAQCETSH